MVTARKRWKTASLREQDGRSTNKDREIALVWHWMQPGRVTGYPVGTWFLWMFGIRVMSGAGKSVRGRGASPHAVPVLDLLMQAAVGEREYARDAMDQGMRWSILVKADQSLEFV